MPTTVPTTTFSSTVSAAASVSLMALTLNSSWSVTEIARSFDRLTLPAVSVAVTVMS